MGSVLLLDNSLNNGHLIWDPRSPEGEQRAKIATGKSPHLVDKTVSVNSFVNNFEELQ